MGVCRPNSRLEVDDPDFCKWCGKDVSGVREELDAVGENSDIDLCGGCEAMRMLLKASAVRVAKETEGEEIHPKQLDDPPEGWELSRESWYQWSAGVAAQWKKTEQEVEC